MTFCIAMKLESGLVGLADTRITTGVECITAKKVSVYENDNHAYFLMTSGLRSARDKALTYFDELLESGEQKYDKLYQAVNAFAAQVRKVEKEDHEALKESGLTFNLYTLIGGQLENDREHKLYLLYPQGNWVEVSQGTPYYAIGESSYGKSLLERMLTYDCDMRTALKIGYLAFDASRRSATDVDYPVDVVLYPTNSYRLSQYRYHREDLHHLCIWWQKRLLHALKELPEEWIDSSFPKLRDVKVVGLDEN